MTIPARSTVPLHVIDRKRSVIIKRYFDLLLSFCLLPILIPVLLLCALAIKLDSRGPVFFTQWRTGRAGKRFRMVKFRTMVENAEELKAELANLNQLSWPDFKVVDDPRTTRVGAFLRKTSLDELPQIINVLRGEMSLVGPRPTSFAASTYSLWHTERLEVTPGITGLWQISGRSDVDFDQRAKLDAQYIRQQNFWFDLKIIFATVTAVVKRRGAY